MLDWRRRRRSYNDDKWGVKYVLENWMANQNLTRLPVFALGVSAGASFALKLPKVTRINGIISGPPAATMPAAPAAPAALELGGGSRLGQGVGLPRSGAPGCAHAPILRPWPLACPCRGAGRASGVL